MKYIFLPSYKKRFLQMSFIGFNVKILKNIWEIIQTRPKGLKNKSLHDLVDFFKEH